MATPPKFPTAAELSKAMQPMAECFAHHVDQIAKTSKQLRVTMPGPTYQRLSPTTPTPGEQGTTPEELATIVEDLERETGELAEELRYQQDD